MGVATINIRFFEVAASIIPILFFVLLFELGLASRNRAEADPAAVLAIALLAVLFLVGGETASMAVLASGHSTRTAFAIVTAALALSLALITMRLMYSIVRASTDWPDWFKRRYTEIGGLFGVIVVASVVTAIYVTAD